MNEPLPAPMSPPPRQKPKPSMQSPDLSNDLSAPESIVQGQNSNLTAADINRLAELEADLDRYLEDGIEQEEMGEACEWHLPGMLEGKYIDPYSVPAKHLIEQEFEKIKTVAEEFNVLLEQNKKRAEEKAKKEQQQ